MRLARRERRYVTPSYGPAVVDRERASDTLALAERALRGGNARLAEETYQRVLGKLGPFADPIWRSDEATDARTRSQCHARLAALAFDDEDYERSIRQTAAAAAARHHAIGLGNCTGDDIRFLITAMVHSATVHERVGAHHEAIEASTVALELARFSRTQTHDVRTRRSIAAAQRAAACLFEELRGRTGDELGEDGRADARIQPTAGADWLDKMLSSSDHVVDVTDDAARGALLASASIDVLGIPDEPVAPGRLRPRTDAAQERFSDLVPEVIDLTEPPEVIDLTDQPELDESSDSPLDPAPPPSASASADGGPCEPPSDPSEAAGSEAPASAAAFEGHPTFAPLGLLEPQPDPAPRADPPAHDDLLAQVAVATARHPSAGAATTTSPTRQGPLQAQEPDPDPAGEPPDGWADQATADDPAERDVADDDAYDRFQRPTRWARQQLAVAEDGTPEDTDGEPSDGPTDETAIDLTDGSTSGATIDLTDGSTSGATIDLTDGSTSGATIDLTDGSTSGATTAAATTDGPALAQPASDPILIPADRRQDQRGQGESGAQLVGRSRGQSLLARVLLGHSDREAAINAHRAVRTATRARQWAKEDPDALPVVALNLIEALVVRGDVLVGTGHDEVARTDLRRARAIADQLWQACPTPTHAVASVLVAVRTAHLDAQPGHEASMVEQLALARGVLARGAALEVPLPLVLRQADDLLDRPAAAADGDRATDAAPVAATGFDALVGLAEQIEWDPVRLAELGELGDRLLDHLQARDQDVLELEPLAPSVAAS